MDSESGYGGDSVSISKSPLRVDTYISLTYLKCVVVVHNTIKLTGMKWIAGLSRLPGISHLG
jgi:hypothetical protein